MEKIIQMTEQEYKGLLQKFVTAWMEYQEKGYGCHIINNETGEAVTDRDSIGGALILPWSEVFKLIYKD